jgi:hypothetical protein
VYGGVLPNGRFLVSLFADRPGEPDHVVFHPDGSNFSPAPTPVREVLSRIDLDVATAHNIGVWLIETAKKAGYVPDEPASK